MLDSEYLAFNLNPTHFREGVASRPWTYRHEGSLPIRENCAFNRTRDTRLVGEKVTEVLPALQCLLLEGLHTSGPVLEAISPFITAREQSTHPIVASYWDRKEDVDNWWDGEV